MPITIYEEKQRQMEELNKLMEKQAKFFNDVLKTPVPPVMRLLYLTQIEYLNSREFIKDCLAKN
jgi:hypothetical protein